MMKTIEYQNNEFFAELSNQATILTPNRRLASTLQKHYAEYQLQSGHFCWKTLDILLISTWLSRLWHDRCSETLEISETYLNPFQEHFLWEKIVAEDAHKLNLLQISETADLMKSAYTLLMQWQIPINHSSLQTDDPQVYLWIKNFEAQCKNQNFFSQSLLPEKILTQSANTKSLPSKLYLIGFTEIAPQYKNLFLQLQNEGMPVFEIKFTHKKTHAKRLKLTNIEHEWLTMARWAKALHFSEPAAKIGCVIPTLDQDRDRVLRIFNDVFSESNSIAADHLPFFNLSAGKPLSAYKIVGIALQVLKIQHKPVAIDAFAQILLSPFFGAAEKERLKRSLFDAKLRELNMNQFLLSQLFDTPITNFCPIFAKNLHHFLQKLNTLKTKASFSQWANEFNELLLLLGWPGERSLNSQEFQVVNEFLQLLNHFSSLDQISEKVSYEVAIKMLYKMANKTIFQTKTPDAPIQILGLLEAASLPFDYLWVSNLTDSNWPPQPKPHPLLSKALQREKQFPHATAERELKFCKNLTEQFLMSANEIIFSHPEKEDDLYFEISPLLKILPEISLQDIVLATYEIKNERIFNTKKIESIIDHVAPSITAHDKIYGGSALIKQQALCPFRAFAEYRLHARELEAPKSGLRAKDRGTIIHKTLELIWNQLQDQKNLLSMTSDALQTCINQKIDDTFLIFKHFKNHSKKYLALEKKRIYNVIFNWLELEKSRPPFKIIATEQKASFQFNHLNLSLRVDRIDELDNGCKMIIDYKTSKTNDIQHWFGDRLEEPQLPLYCIAQPEKTIGIAFAQITANEYAWKGLSKIAIEMKGIKLVSEIKNHDLLSWDEQIQFWKTSILKLSQDFHDGIAHVDPKDADKTCTWCALSSLCRVEAK